MGDWFVCEETGDRWYEHDNGKEEDQVVVKNIAAHEAAAFSMLAAAAAKNAVWYMNERLGDMLTEPDSGEKKNEA